MSSKYPHEIERVDDWTCRCIHCGAQWCGEPDIHQPFKEKINPRTLEHGNCKCYPRAKAAEEAGDE